MQALGWFILFCVFLYIVFHDDRKPPTRLKYEPRG